jgi:hypothetical protein
MEWHSRELKPFRRSAREAQPPGAHFPGFSDSVFTTVQRAGLALVAVIERSLYLRRFFSSWSFSP